MTKEITQLGRYQIEAHLGAGAHADVYRATDPLLKRTVALKVLKPALIADEHAFARFTRETQVLASLVHPHIAWLWDMGKADGSYFIAMRYVDGKSLDKVIAERGRLPWKEALNLVEQVADGLQFAHEKGLVHRDVKPQNIIVSETEGAVLTDFGLVRAIASSGMTTTGAMLGTPHYMAPETWESEDVDPPADQYSLACVLVEMLTGKILFDGKTPPIMMGKHIKPLELPSSLGNGVPAGVEAVLRKALARKPAERYASMKEFSAALAVPQVKKPAPVTKAIGVQVGEGAQSGSRKRTTRPGTHPPSQITIDVPKKDPIKWYIAAGLAVVALIVLIMQNNGRSTPVPTETPVPAATETPSNTLAPTFTPIKVFTPTITPRPEELTDTKGVTMLLVPASEFTMGSHGFDNEQPIHTVYLDAYYMDKYEVTNGLYKVCVEARACQPPGSIGSHTRSSYFGNSEFEDHPVIYVDWDMAKTYCEWRGARLPTEAEWEKAARGTDARIYPWGNEWDVRSTKRLNFSDKNDPAGASDTVADDGYADTAPVGSYPRGASPYGLHDMAGNVWEWVSDWFGVFYYQGSPNSNHLGPGSGYGRGVRGGSWHDIDITVRSSGRYWFEVSFAYSHIGFRCSRSLP